MKCNTIFPFNVSSPVQNRVAEDCLKNVGLLPEAIPTIHAFGKDINIYKRGVGAIPLLVVGPANLFKKQGLIPEDFDHIFTTYFVDFFEKSANKQFNYKDITLEDFADAFESVRKQLGHEKIALFGHSANGVLAIIYAVRYPERVLLNILISASPIWGDHKNKLVSVFFQHNADIKRQKLFKSDQKILENSKEQTQSISSFVAKYNARRAHFYCQPLLSSWAELWTDINMDEDLVLQFFSLINNFDVRKMSMNFQSPTFLALGLYDYSCPFYSWTDDTKEQLENMEYYIFEESAHYPQVEQSLLFSEKLFRFMEQKKLIASNMMACLSTKLKLFSMN